MGSFFGSSWFTPFKSFFLELVLELPPLLGLHVGGSPRLKELVDLIVSDSNLGFGLVLFTIEKLRQHRVRALEHIGIQVVRGLFFLSNHDDRHIFWFYRHLDDVIVVTRFLYAVEGITLKLKPNTN